MSPAEQVARLREQIERGLKRTERAEKTERTERIWIRPSFSDAASDLPWSTHFHPMSAHLVRLSIAALVTCAVGCTSWSRLGDGRPVPARGTVQVWSAGEHTLLRDPRTVDDSMVGRGPLPDTTRRTVALGTIDSLRIQTADAGKAVIVGTGVAIAVLLAYTQGLNFK